MNSYEQAMHMSLSFQYILKVEEISSLHPKHRAENMSLDHQ